MGFLGFLTLVLLVLKLVGVIAVSWFVVFLPLILGFVLWLLIIAIGALITR
jgi:hypothetical protein